MRDGMIHGGGEFGNERIYQREKNGLFVGEVEVEAALGAIRGADDIIYDSAVVPLFGEDDFGGIEEALAGRVFVARLRMPFVFGDVRLRCRLMYSAHVLLRLDFRADANRRAGLLGL